MSAERPNTACDSEDWQNFEDDGNEWEFIQLLSCQSCEAGEPLSTFGDDWDDACWCCHGEYTACERCTEELS